MNCFNNVKKQKIYKRIALIILFSFFTNVILSRDLYVKAATAAPSISITQSTNAYVNKNSIVKHTVRMMTYTPNSASLTDNGIFLDGTKVVATHTTSGASGDYGTRGIELVAYDNNFNIIKAVSYDVYGNPSLGTNLANDINSIPNGSLVILQCFDSYSLNLDLRTALKNIGVPNSSIMATDADSNSVDCPNIRQTFQYACYKGDSSALAYYYDRNGVTNSDISFNVGNTSIYETIAMADTSNVNNTAYTLTLPNGSKCMNNGSNNFTFSGGMPQYQFPITIKYLVFDNGNYNFTGTTYDGTIGTNNININNFDNFSPIGNISADKTNWTNGNVNLTLNSSDNIYYNNTGNTIDTTGRDWSANPFPSWNDYKNVTFRVTGSIKKISAATDTTTAIGLFYYNTAGSPQWYQYKVYYLSSISDWTSFDFLATVPSDYKDSLSPWIQINMNHQPGYEVQVKDLKYELVSSSGIKSVTNPSGSASSTYTATTNGTYNFTALDNVGNSHVFNYTVSNIDKTAPTASFSPNGCNWQAGGVGTTLTASDDMSGIASIKWYHSIDGVNFQYEPSNDNQIVLGAGWWGDWAGMIGYVKADITDNAGNTKTIISNPFKIDNSAPTVPTISGSSTIGTKQNTNFTFTIGGSTDVYSGTSPYQTGSYSGIAKYQYSMDGGTTWTDYSATITLSSDGNYNIIARTVDNAGNISGNTSAYSVIVDKTAPSLNLTPSTSSWTNQNVAITANGTDSLSGVKSITLPNGSTVNGSSTNYTVSSNGTYNFTVTDNAGNSKVQSFTVSNIDKTSPIVNSMSITNITETGFDIVADISDIGSGINYIDLPVWRSGNYQGMKCYRFTNQSNGVHTYHINMQDIGAGSDYIYIGTHIRDNAGNQADLLDKSFKLDSTLPSLTLAQPNTSWTNVNTTFNTMMTDNFNIVSSISISGPGINSSVSLQSKPKILCLSASSAYSATLNYLISKGYDVTINTNATDVSQLAGYDIILYDGYLGSVGNCNLLNTAYSQGYKVLTLGNDTGPSIHPITSSAGRSGTYALTQYLNNGTMGSLQGASDHLMGSYDGSAETDSTSLITGWASDTRPIAMDTAYPNSPDVLYSVNSNGGKWIHFELSGTHGMTDAAINELMSGTMATRQSYSQNFTVSQNGTYTITATDLFGNFITKTITASNIDKTPPLMGLTQDAVNYTNSTVRIGVSASDSLSGLDHVVNPDGTTNTTGYYTVNKNGTYSFTVYDKAGNSTTQSITVNSINSVSLTLSDSTVNFDNSFTEKTMTATVKSGTAYDLSVTATGNFKNTTNTSATSIPISSLYLRINGGTSSNFLGVNVPKAIATNSVATSGTNYTLGFDMNMPVGYKSGTYNASISIILKEH